MCGPFVKIFGADDVGSICSLMRASEGYGLRDLEKGNLQRFIETSAMAHENLVAVY